LWLPAPWWPTELLAIPAYDRRGWFQPDTDAAALVDIGAFGRNSPDDIFGSHYCGHVPPP